MSSQSSHSAGRREDRVPAHEVPRIVSETDGFARTDDTSALLRVVEEQARDLAKLRRALWASRELAAQRMEIIRGMDSGLAEGWTVRARQAMVRIVRSAWWRIGRRLGIVTGASWMAWADRTRFAQGRRVTPPPNMEISGETKVAPTALQQVTLIPSTDSCTGILARECRNLAIDVILDIGASDGELAQDLRAWGYRGHIVSFGPSPAAHAALASSASQDLLWDVVLGCAVDSEARDEATEEPKSSDNLCPIMTLDHFIEQTFLDPTMRFGLQLHRDSEIPSVLSGAKQNLDRIKVVRCSIAADGGFGDRFGLPALSSILARYGYQCVASGPERQNPHSAEPLRIAGVFVRR